MERDFKGIWIPRNIWLDENLNWTEKLLMVEIDSLSSLDNGCFATNDYFSKFFGLSKDRISKLVSSLKNKGYVEIRMQLKAGSKQVEKRIITTKGYRQKQLEGIGENNYTPLVENNYPPIGENNEDNNTILINTSFNNTIYNSIVEKFNSVCISLPQVSKITEPRKKAIKARLFELNNDIKKIEQVFALAEESDFLAGRNGNWQANFDWLMKSSNFFKVLEGNYKNKEAINGSRNSRHGLPKDIATKIRECGLDPNDATDVQYFNSYGKYCYDAKKAGYPPVKEKQA